MQRRDLATWLALAGVGLLLCWVAVSLDARLGAASPPFLGRYAPSAPVWLLGAVAVAAAVLWLSAGRLWERAPWPAVLAGGYVATLAWGVSLALRDGPAGLAASLTDLDGPGGDVADVGDDPGGWLAGFTDSDAAHSRHTWGHPPGPVLLLWSLRRLGLGDDLLLASLVAAVGALVVPLVLHVARSACGDLNARRYVPVLALAPYALWSAGSMDAVAAVLGAAMAAAGVVATERRGRRAAVWGLGAGVLLGVAALFAYAAAWLGLSVICLYFARRRPLLNVLTGVGALAPVLAAQAFGFSWTAGLLSARADHADEIAPYRAALWWAGLSLVALLLAAGPPMVASLRKLRNTPAWPFLMGAGAAVVFSVLTGFARGGAEHAWLAFFPWLTIAATAPERQAGPPPEAPLLLAGAGAISAIALAAVLR